MGYECILDECVDGCFCVKWRKRTNAVASHPYAFASSSRIRWRSPFKLFGGKEMVEVDEGEF
jgi:hypothetical protein